MTIKKHGTVEVHPDGRVTIKDFVFEGVNMPEAQAEAVLWAIHRLTEPQPRISIGGGWPNPDSKA